MLAESRRQSQHEYDAGAAVKVKRVRARAFLEHEAHSKGEREKVPEVLTSPGVKPKGHESTHEPPW